MKIIDDVIGLDDILGGRFLEIQARLYNLKKEYLSLMPMLIKCNKFPKQPIQLLNDKFDIMDKEFNEIVEHVFLDSMDYQSCRLNFLECLKSVDIGGTFQQVYSVYQAELADIRREFNELYGIIDVFLRCILYKMAYQEITFLSEGIHDSCLNLLKITLCQISCKTVISDDTKRAISCLLNKMGNFFSSDKIKELVEECYLKDSKT